MIITLHCTKLYCTVQYCVMSKMRYCVSYSSTCSMLIIVYHCASSSCIVTNEAALCQKRTSPQHTPSLYRSGQYSTVLYRTVPHSSYPNLLIINPTMFYPISHLYLIPFFPTLPYPIHSPAENTSKSDRPDLTAARVVVSGKSDNI